MGVAADRLSSPERERVARDILQGVNERLSSGLKVSAHCPYHVETTPGGAFYYDAENDVGRCYSCGNWSDLIGIHNLLTGQDESDPDGMRDFLKKYCGGVGERPTAKQKKQKPAPRGWIPKACELPPPLWRKKALEFVQRAAHDLQNNHVALEKLAAWGITPATAKACQMGWNDKDRFPKFTEWGLPHLKNSNGRERCIFLPKGLVLPFLEEGEVVRIKIRAEEPKEPKDKYRHVSGGSIRCFIFGDRKASIWIVEETERDGGLLWQELQGLGIGVMATGSASIRPDSVAAEILRGAELVLVALDNDKAGTENAHKFWLAEFPNAVRWIVPSRIGKDPGDLVGKCDVRQWVLAGLPAHILRKVEARVAGSVVEWPEPDAAATADYRGWRVDAVAMGVRIKVATGKKPEPVYPEDLAARFAAKYPDYPEPEEMVKDWRETFEAAFGRGVGEVERLLNKARVAAQG